MFLLTLKTPDPILGAWRWVALLVLLGFPLACDRTPTEPVTTTQPRIETSLLFPLVTLASPFDASQYFSIDVNRAAQQQYGSSATAVAVSNHLYGWRAVVNGTQYPIDMRRAVAQQWGSGYVLGAVGVGLYDWRAVHWSALPHEVLPVMVIASDYFYNVSAVQTGLSNLQSVLITTREWYRAAYSSAISSFPNPPLPGKTFNMLQPLVVFDYSSYESSSYTAAQWNAFSTAALVSNASNEYETVYPRYSLGGPTGTAVRVLLSVFAGNGLTVPIGGGGGVYNGLYGASGLAPYTNLPGLAVVPPAVNSLTCSWGTGGDGLLYDIPCARATWLIGHYLGYTFGLQNCDAGGGPYDCLDSIMGAGYPLPPTTVLTSAQISTLSASGFFF